MLYILLLAHGGWFSPGTLTSSTTKTGRHDIAEILPKVALNTKNQIKQILIFFWFMRVKDTNTCIHILCVVKQSIFL
jgi:hypothetical protein